MLNVDPTTPYFVQIPVADAIETTYTPVRTFEGQTYFDYAAELHMSGYDYHPADVALARLYASSYARKCERVAGNPLPQRGEIPAAYASIFRYALTKQRQARQAREMEALMHLPVMHLN